MAKVEGSFGLHLLDCVHYLLEDVSFPIRFLLSEDDLHYSGLDGSHLVNITSHPFDASFDDLEESLNIHMPVLLLIGKIHFYTKLLVDDFPPRPFRICSLPPKMGYKLQNIIGINLILNNLGGAIPSYISNCSKLEVLYLQSNSFSGPIPNSLGELEFLEVLKIFENRLTSESSSTGVNFMTSLANCRYLKTLEISKNPLNIVLPSSFGNLSNSLELFLAFGCNIKGKISNEVGNLSSLMALELSLNELTGVVPRGIGGLNQLQKLNLGYNKLSGCLPNSICNLKYLDSLYLSKNQIWGSIPECMGNATSLREIYLPSNRLSFNIPSSIWKLKDLLKLDLSSNFLNGSLHLEIGNMKVAIYINLSRNHFSGYIPTTIGGLQSLINFSLASNLLQGSIPDSFGSMISVEYLDLSNNNLTGGIPRSLEKLHYLKGFNVSFNRLSGEIPSKGQFVNFTYRSFLSNEDLCGSPRLKVPPCKVHSNSHSLIRRALRIVFISVAMLIVGILVIILLLWKCKRKNSTTNEVDSLKKIVPLRISYYELQRATQGFNSNNLLGAGSFGSVYKGTIGNGLLFAVKVFNLQVEDAFKSFATECEVLRNLRHRNLTKVISVCSNMDFKALILEYMPNGSLDSWLYSDDRQSLHIMQRLNIMIDVASALEYLHHGYSSPIAHCDLKPTNVLIDEDMVGHVSDFGIAKLLGDDESVAYTITMATIGYIAPEYGSSGMVSTKCDIYNYGIMLMEVFTKRKPNDEMFTGDLSLRSWVSNSLSHTLDEILDPTLMRPEELKFRQKLQCISSILELALSCTIKSPRERMDIQVVLAKLNKIKRECLTIF
ncbi:PREDICTED: receptor kinase-like protein Xa21 [Ipomoea nil]|uniref:receptor kinase-like protein Xa21 n=1 Tax=Ipomoea nil TaxID=35883 RepID=UPI000901E94A|nr:PREDICTED: receptor kinase-like protein Xa21 [Ipomoea nil]